ncbi:hypothetical protein KHP57_08390, partial [Algiphilus sp. NNCM1]|nr:hypothetical protein [Algiphilus acroporae]
RRQAPSGGVCCRAGGQAWGKPDRNPASRANARRYQRHRPEQTLLYQIVECWRALKTDQLCSLKIDQGWKPGALAPGVFGL